MIKKTLNAIGHHYIAEASGCNPEIISSVEKVQQILVKAAEIAGAQVWSISISKFPPQGVSGVVVIAESHLAIHTWPEYNYASVDLFTCGTSVDPWKAFDLLKESLEADYYSFKELKRGLPDPERAADIQLLHKPQAASIEN